MTYLEALPALVVGREHVFQLALDGKALDLCFGFIVNDDIDIGVDPKAVIDRVLLFELNVDRGIRSPPA